MVSRQLVEPFVAPELQRKREWKEFLGATSADEIINGIKNGSIDNNYCYRIQENDTLPIHFIYGPYIKK